jgi:hypothetical protein
MVLARLRAYQARRLARDAQAPERTVTGFRSPPERHWRSYGTEPLPTAAEAMTEPMRAFPSWFLKVTCDRCGKDRMLNESHMTDHQRRMVLRLLLNRLRHDGCGGLC